MYSPPGLQTSEFAWKLLLAALIVICVCAVRASCLSGGACVFRGFKILVQAVWGGQDCSASRLRGGELSVHGLRHKCNRAKARFHNFSCLLRSWILLMFHTKNGRWGDEIVMRKVWGGAKFAFAKFEGGAKFEYATLGEKQPPPPCDKKIINSS